MFRTIIFRPQKINNMDEILNIGLLLECMLFYEHTVVVANTTILKQIIEKLGGESLNELIDGGFVDIVYLESMLGIMTNTRGLSKPIYKPVVITSPQHEFPDELRKHCIEIIGKPGKARRLAQRLENKITVEHHNPVITENANKLILNNEYLRNSFSTILKTLLPSLKWDDSIEIEAYPREDGIAFDGDINFFNLNYHLNCKYPNQEWKLSPESLFVKMVEAETDVYYSSQYLGEIVTNTIGSKLVSNRMNNVILTANHKYAYDAFCDYVVNDIVPFREAINSSIISIGDAVSIVLKSRKFKDWLQKQTTTEEAIRDYSRAISEDTFLSTLPGKILRFSLFTGIGAAVGSIGTPIQGLAYGAGLNAFDTFLFEKIVGGWKPNHFIEQDLKKRIQSA